MHLPFMVSSTPHMNPATHRATYGREVVGGMELNRKTLDLLK